MENAPLAPGRLKPLSDLEPRILLASPVGRLAKELLPHTLEMFRKAGADCRLLLYDDWELKPVEGVQIIRDTGFKWQLAFRHLHPDTVRDYDYIFFWDDDIDARGFDPLRFARIMEVNRLDLAQPAISSPHGYSHHITRCAPCPAPRLTIGGTVNPIVGRLTNFVEIMVPVFSREGWREIYGYIDPTNESGWGYDYVPMGRKGVVDALSVVHTRPVRSLGEKSERELEQFLEAQGILKHAHVNQGFLFEAIDRQ